MFSDLNYTTDPHETLHSIYPASTYATSNFKKTPSDLRAKTSML